MRILEGGFRSWGVKELLTAKLHQRPHLLLRPRYLHILLLKRLAHHLLPLQPDHLHHHAVAGVAGVTLLLLDSSCTCHVLCPSLLNFPIEPSLIAPPLSKQYFILSASNVVAVKVTVVLASLGSADE